MIDNNLSYIIDYIYQKAIEKREVYVDCIYDFQLFNRRYYNPKDDIINRFDTKIKIGNYIPYECTTYTILRLSKYIEITSNDYGGEGIGDDIINVGLDHPCILYYDKNKLLLNNNFLTKIKDVKNYNHYATTLTLLNKLRLYYDKRN